MSSNPIINQQVPPNAPRGVDAKVATGLILPPTTMDERLGSFPEDVYNLSPGTHLRRFLDALLGDSGAGQLRKRNLLTRMQASAEGTMFFDLDRFYGALFGVARRSVERPTLNPYVDVGTSSEWTAVDKADGSYRSRITQLARALQHGGTAIGIEMIAEAMMAVDCEVEESFTSGNRWLFTVRVKRVITQEERYDLFKVLQRVKPAGTMVSIVAAAAPIYTEVDLSAVHSDSEHWEVRSRTVASAETSSAYAVAGTSAEPQEQRRPPFSGYQGDSWSFVSQILGTVGYREEVTGDVIGDLYEQVVFPSGARDYKPSLAVKSVQSINAARLSSDGVFASHFFSSTRASSRGVFDPSAGLGHAVGELDPSGRSSLAKSYFDGMSLDEILRVSPERLSLLRRQDDDGSRFWSTPPASSASPDWDVIEVRLQEPQTVNHISFEIPHFPLVCEVQLLDSATSAWVTVDSATVRDSFPSTIVSRVDSINQVHPQHGVSGHWVPISRKIPAMRTQSLRVRMRRNAVGVSPVDTLGNPLPYSLGLRSLDFGYRVSSRNDIPVLPSGDADDIGTSLDILGNRVFFDVVEQSASTLTEDDGLWVCEPQPIAEAVVNVFVDVRAADGSPQEIDRFWLDPIYPGPRIHLYHSSEDPEIIDFVSADTPLVDGAAWATNPTVSATGIVSDATSEQSLAIPNSRIQWQPGSGWTLAIHLVTQATSAAAAGALFAFGGNTVRMGAGTVSVDPLGNDPIEVDVAYNSGEHVYLLVHHLAGTTTVTTSIGGVVATASGPSSYENPTTVYLGPDPDEIAEGSVPCILVNLSLIQSAPQIDLEEWVANTESFTLKAPSPGPSNTDSSLIRSNAQLRSTADVWGVRGGHGNFYEAMEWTPIPRDYILTRGFLTVPPTNAKFWKFEFSDLVGRPYEIFEPMERTVKVFPSSLQTEFVRSSSAYEQWPGLATAVDVQIPFADSPSTDTSSSFTGYLPTEAIYTEEIDAASRLRKISHAYGFVPWHARESSGFTATGQHRYDELGILHSQKVAFFVGLNQIKAYRSPLTVADNYPAIVERFGQPSRLASNTWILRPGSLISDVKTYAQATSATIPTRSTIEAVQFATQQSPPLQLLRDEGFRDPALALNLWDGTYGWRATGDATLYYQTIDTSVLIGRDADDGPAFDASDSGIVNDPIHPTWATYPKDNPTPGSVGGIESEFVTVSGAGIIHAAVRVTAVTDILSNPLRLQILADDGTVLRETLITARSGDTVEATASYVLGSYNSGTLPLIEPRSIVEPVVNSPFAGEDELVDLNAEEDFAPAGSLYQVRLVQTGSSVGTAWRVHKLSLFDEGIVWEFSVDDGVTWITTFGVRNNPYGVVNFPTPGTNLKWRVTGYRPNLSITSLQIRPWYTSYEVARMASSARGPNASAFDAAPPIELDPEFQAWSGSIPLSWYASEQSTEITPFGQPASNEFSAERYQEVALADTVVQADEATWVLLGDFVLDEEGNYLTDEQGNRIIME